MEEVQTTFHELDELCKSINNFIEHDAKRAVYRAPVIDHFYPDDYQQDGIAGLSKFFSCVESERSHVEGIVESGTPPPELASNAPHLLAVWHEFVNAPWPLVCIHQFIDCGPAGQVKVDAVVEGGDTWIKVNTIKESRLAYEFMVQDANAAAQSATGGDDDHGPTPSSSSGPLNNSLIERAAALMEGAEAYPRPAGLAKPRVQFVLNRMEEHPAGGYEDPRIPQTWKAIRDLGVDLVFGPATPRPNRVDRDEPLPSRKIVVDLSVLVALCCDSTHHPLPESQAELEARFRTLQPSADDPSKLELGHHGNVTRDLRDQLSKEMQHPLVKEMQDRLGKRLSSDGETEAEPEFWVTQEVKRRLPLIVDVIGGQKERARAQALFEEGNEAGGAEGDNGNDFWADSRWRGKAGLLANIKMNVLDNDSEDNIDLETLDISLDRSPFARRMMQVCTSMLRLVEPDTNTPTTSDPETRPQPPTTSRRSANPDRVNTLFPPPSKLPSAHTLRTLRAGAKRRWTVLINNRGAVNKVLRAMGVREGLPYDTEGDKTAAVWLVNPSSLAEWRRTQVEESNRKLLEGNGNEK